MNLQASIAGLSTDLEECAMDHRQLIVEIVAIFAANSAITSLIIISLGISKSPLIPPWAI